jgi:hypothetical protein
MKNKRKSLLFLSIVSSLFLHSCAEEEFVNNEDEIVLETIDIELPQLQITPETPETRSTIKVEGNYSYANYFMEEVLNTGIYGRKGGKLYVTSTYSKEGEKNIIAENIYEFNEKSNRLYSYNPVKIKKGYTIKLDVKFQVKASDVKTEDATKSSTKSYIYTKDILIGSTTISAAESLTPHPNLRLTVSHAGALIQTKMINYTGKNIKSVTYDKVEMYDAYKNIGDYFLIVDSVNGSINKTFEVNYNDGTSLSYPVEWSNGLENNKIYVAEIDLFNTNGKIILQNPYGWFYVQKEMKIEDEISALNKYVLFKITDENGTVLTDDIQVYKTNDTDDIEYNEYAEKIIFNEYADCYRVKLNSNYFTKIVYNNIPYYYGIECNTIKEGTVINLSFNREKKEWITLEEGGITKITSLTDLINIYKNAELSPDAKTLSISKKKFIQTNNLHFKKYNQENFVFNIIHELTNNKIVLFDSSTYEGINENTQIVNFFGYGSEGRGLFDKSKGSIFKNITFYTKTSSFRKEYENFYGNFGLFSNESTSTTFNNCGVINYDLAFMYSPEKMQVAQNVGLFIGKGSSTYNDCFVDNCRLIFHAGGNVKDTSISMDLFQINEYKIEKLTWLLTQDIHIRNEYNTSAIVENNEYKIYSITPPLNSGFFCGKGINTVVKGSKIKDSEIHSDKIAAIGGMIGRSTGSIIFNCNVSNLGMSSQLSIAGGYVGIEDRVITSENCSLIETHPENGNFNIVARYVGGLVGLLYNNRPNDSFPSRITNFEVGGMTLAASGVIGSVLGILSADCVIKGDETKKIVSRLFLINKYFLQKQGPYFSFDNIAIGGVIGFYIPNPGKSNSNGGNLDIGDQNLKIDFGHTENDYGIFNSEYSQSDFPYKDEPGKTEVVGIHKYVYDYQIRKVYAGHLIGSVFIDKRHTPIGDRSGSFINIHISSPLGEGNKFVAGIGSICKGEDYSAIYYRYFRLDGLKIKAPYDPFYFQKAEYGIKNDISFETWLY